MKVSSSTFSWPESDSLILHLQKLFIHLLLIALCFVYFSNGFVCSFVRKNDLWHVTYHTSHGYLASHRTTAVAFTSKNVLRIMYSRSPTPNIVQ